MDQLKARVTSLKEVFERGRDAPLPNLPSDSAITLHARATSLKEVFKRFPHDPLRGGFTRVNPISIPMTLPNVPSSSAITLNGSKEEDQRQPLAWKMTFDLKYIYQNINTQYFRSRFNKCLGCLEEISCRGGYCFKRKCVEKRHMAQGTQLPTCLKCNSEQVLVNGYCRDNKCLKNYSFDQRLLSKGTYIYSTSTNSAVVNTSVEAPNAESRMVMEVLNNPNWEDI